MKRTYSQRIASYVEAELANEGPGVRSCVLPLSCPFVVIFHSIRHQLEPRKEPGNDQTAATGICRYVLPFEVSPKSA